MSAVEFTQPIAMRDCSGGVMSSVSNTLIPDANCVLSLNLRYDKVGSAVQRYGYSKIGADVATSFYPVGLGYWINGAGTADHIVAAYNSKNWAYNGTWHDIGNNSNNAAKVRYAQYLDLLFKVGGLGATQTWDGNVSHSFGNTQVAKAATGTITFSNNSLFPLVAGMQLTVADKVITEGVDWSLGLSSTLSASNLNTALNAAGSSFFTSSVVGSVVTVTASAVGESGNSLVLVPTATMTVNNYTGMVGSTITIRGKTLSQSNNDYFLGPDNATTARSIALAIMNLGDTAYKVDLNSNVITLVGQNMSGNQMDASTNVVTSDFTVLASTQEGGVTISLNPNPAVDSTTGEVANSNTLFGGFQAPEGSLIMNYKNVMYIGGNPTFPDRVYLSSVPDIDGNITWSLENYLDINPSDGDHLTAFAKTGTTGLFFKRNFVYRWNGTSTDAEPVINVGAVSQEVVANVQGLVYYFNPKGVFSTDSGTPVEVSRPIRDWIEAIPEANYENMCAYQDGNRYGLYLGGDITKDGRTYSNLCLEYDTQTQAWQFQQFHHDFRAFVNVTDSGTEDYVAGAALSFVTHMDSSNTLDIDQPINFERQTRGIYFDGEFSVKALDDFAFYLTGAPGSQFQASSDGGTWTNIGSTVGSTTTAIGKNIQGRLISFRIVGLNRSTPAEWSGFDIVKGRSQGFRVTQTTPT